MVPYAQTKDVRAHFKMLLEDRKFTGVNREASMTALMGSRTIEIVGSMFIADEESIFGEVNKAYVEREEQWYNSMSLNVNDIPGGAPAVWKSVADKDGFINSNYGWCIYSDDNECQYDRVYLELNKNAESRRAIAIYTRPTMWLDFNKNGRSDFMCTNTVQYLIRDGAVHAIVNMRSNDAVFGYKNDRAWQQHVLERLTFDLNDKNKFLYSKRKDYEVGNLYWQTGSLHVYERHFHLIDPNFPQTTGK